MCLFLNEESARLKKNLRRRKRPIIAYKLLQKIGEYYSSFFYYKIWQINQKYNSDREIYNLDSDEIKNRTIHYGFHFYLDKENINECKVYNRLFCPFQIQNPSMILCRHCSDSLNLILGKFEIDPKDIVGIGNYIEENDCIVAMSAKFIGIKE